MICEQNQIIINQADSNDIPIIESILLDAVKWMDEIGRQLWSEESVKWENLSKSYGIDDFYVAYINEEPVGCVAIIDYDPFLWEDIAKGESLFIHKLAVKRSVRGIGVSDALIDYFKRKGKAAGVKSVRLDVHVFRPKLCEFYEKHGFVCSHERGH